MDIARSTTDEILYHISGFIKLSESQIEAKRHQLICEVCKNPAYFKKSDDKGFGACFGARPHLIGCILSSKENEKTAASIFDEKDKKKNEGKVIKITFPNESEKIVNPVETDDETGKAGTAHHYDGSGSIAKTNFRRNLKKILIALIVKPDFSKSDMTISIGSHNYKAKEIFVNLSEEDESDLRDRIYWGEVKKPKNFTTHAFLDGENLGINIHSSLFDKFKTKAKIKDFSELENCYIIGFGKKQNGLIKISDVNQIEVVKKFEF